MTEPSKENLERARELVEFYAPDSRLTGDLGIYIAHVLDAAEQRGAKREREACLETCLAISARLDRVPTHESGVQASGADECAAAIRARGKS